MPTSPWHSTLHSTMSLLKPMYRMMRLQDHSTLHSTMSLLKRPDSPSHE